MSSPLSIFFKNLRLRAGITQLDLAHSMGYEQAYVSSIELGKKKPSQEFLKILTNRFELSEEDQRQMALAVKNSNDRFTLPAESSEELYRFCNDLFEKIDKLHPAILTSMHLMLKVEERVGESPRIQPTRIRRRPARPRE